MALVLTVKQNGSIWIGEAKVTAMFKRGKVKLIVDAPASVKVLRDSLKVRAA